MSLLATIEDRPSLTRDECARFYADVLTGRYAREVDWGKINRAIIARWSIAGLVYVKRKAWALSESLHEGRSEA